MTTQHTPGPWIAKTYSTETVRDAVGIYAGTMVLPIVPDIAGRSIEECDANIRLIAAAPDLLDALLDALPYVEDVLDNPDQLACFKSGVVQRHAKAILSAIAKATGGAP